MGRRRRRRRLRRGNVVSATYTDTARLAAARHTATDRRREVTAVTNATMDNTSAHCELESSEVLIPLWFQLSVTEDVDKGQRTRGWIAWRMT